MVCQVEVRKAPSSPTQHVGLYLVDGVPSGCRPEASDRVPDFTPIDLGAPAYVKSRSGLKALRPVFFLVTDHAPAHAELRFLVEDAETLLEVIRLKRQVSIELDYEFPVLTFDRSQTVV